MILPPSLDPEPDDIEVHANAVRNMERRRSYFRPMNHYDPRDLDYEEPPEEQDDADD